MIQQIVSIQDTLYAIMFVLAANLVVSIFILCRKDKENARIDETGTNGNVPGVWRTETTEVPDSRGERNRVDYSRSSPQSILHRHWKKEDET